jgi:hypothetical protein
MRRRPRSIDAVMPSDRIGRHRGRQMSLDCRRRPQCSKLRSSRIDIAASVSRPRKSGGLFRRIRLGWRFTVPLALSAAVFGWWIQTPTNLVPRAYDLGRVRQDVTDLRQHKTQCARQGQNCQDNAVPAHRGSPIRMPARSGWSGWRGRTRSSHHGLASTSSSISRRSSWSRPLLTNRSCSVPAALPRLSRS